MLRCCAVLPLLWLAGCVTCPLRCPDTLEAQALAGDRAAPCFERRFGGVCRDAAAETRMQRVAARLLAANPELPRRVTCRLLDSPCRNAASLPVGRVYITRGLYRHLSTDAALAAVIAHELAHVVTRDHFKGRPPDAAAALARERDADVRAVTYLARSNCDPNQMVTAIDLVAHALPPSWAATRRSAVEAAVSAAYNISLCAAD